MKRFAPFPNRQSAAMQVSAFDRVSAGLWTLMIFFGVTASFGGLAWLQAQREKDVGGEHQTTFWLFPDDSRDSAASLRSAANNDPGVDDFPEVEKSQLADAIAAVTNVPSRQRVLLANFDGTEEDMGLGDGIEPPGRVLDPVTPRHDAERWSIEYESEGIDSYLQQLSAFGIEIGFVSKVTDRVEIVSNLHAKPEIQVTTKGSERRCYFIHRDNKLRSWDLQVSEIAGVKPEGKIMVQFYPPAATDTLLRLETAEAAARGIERGKIQRTMFRVRTVGDGYEYYVADIVSN